MRAEKEKREGVAKKKTNKNKIIRGLSWRKVNDVKCNRYNDDKVVLLHLFTRVMRVLKISKSIKRESMSRKICQKKKMKNRINEMLKVNTRA